ncbi:carboxypeptidase-like regulatory domain-containing protein [bacterium]|nr:carboxypeptidase-like regulatory domain-containing protein [bacterium]
MRASHAASRAARFGLFLRLQRILPVVCGTALVALPGLTAAASGGSGGGAVGNVGTPGEPRRVQNDASSVLSAALRVLPESVRIEGKVHDKAGAPLEGIRVRLFWNGMSLEAVRTDVDGSFLLSQNPPAGDDDTTDLWIESPDPDRYVDVNVILLAGKSARDNNIFSACTAKVDITGTGAMVDVTMLSPDERKEMVQQSRCLESEPD